MLTRSRAEPNCNCKQLPEHRHRTGQ